MEWSIIEFGQTHLSFIGVLTKNLLSNSTANSADNDQSVQVDYDL